MIERRHGGVKVGGGTGRGNGRVSGAEGELRGRALAGMAVRTGSRQTIHTAGRLQGGAAGGLQTVERMSGGVGGADPGAESVIISPHTTGAETTRSRCKQRGGAHGGDGASAAAATSWDVQFLGGGGLTPALSASLSKPVLIERATGTVTSD